MDDLDDILSPPENLLLPVVEQLKTAVMAQPLGSLSLATPADRKALIQTHEMLVDLNSLIRARIQGIDMLVKRHFGDSKVRRLYYSETEAPLAYEPAGKVYRIADPEGLRSALGALVVSGALTHDEVDAAVHPEIEWRVNHTAINTLSRRGEAIQAIIESFRAVEEPDPLGGRLHWPQIRER